MAIGGADTLLNSGAIGSCVVIVAYDSKSQIGAMAHIMLPGNAPENYNFRSTKFASNAVTEMMTQLYNKGATNQNIKACLLGGSNILKRDNDTIGNENIKSVEKIISDLNLDAIPLIRVLNKKDLIDKATAESLRKSLGGTAISAKDKSTLMPLIKKMKTTTDHLRDRTAEPN